MDEEEIFYEALALTSRQDQLAYLERACANDRALRLSVEALLRANVGACGFLDQPALAPVAVLDSSSMNEQPGALIGPYKLIEQIGEGGMGSVWMAQQTDPVKRLVAVKLIKAGMDTRQVIARFDAERQALALMDHGNIGRMLDAGTSNTGRHYFVMDLVKGIPITKYCDEHHLTPRQRLELFIPVCQAVQHAHQKGVIHRDLKPSNVLVALYDGTPVPKVIDFGVAKATGQQLTEKTLVTGFGTIVGTLEYMSPEQAEINQLDVDTRSDIYSLGVILYELLVGTTPLERKRVKESGMLEALRIIRQEDVPTLSNRLATTVELPAIAANRGLEPAKLTKLVRGELDWIVLKALEKNRNRRYETADNLARDIQRYLKDETLEASPRSRLYQFSKFARRNKVPVIAALVVLLTLTGAIIGTTWGLFHVDQNRRKAERALYAESAARNQAMAALRSMTDEIVQNQLAREVFLRDEDKEFLRKIIKHYEGFAAITSDDAESRAIRAEGYAQVGVIRHRLGELKDAEAALTAAEELWKRLVAQSPGQLKFQRELAHSQNNLGTLFRALGQWAKAEASFANALANYTQLASDHPELPEFRQYLGQCFNNQGNLFSTLGRVEESETAYSNAVSNTKQLVADFPDRPNYRRYLAQCCGNLAILLRAAGRMKEAESSFTEALAIQQKLVSEFPGRLEYRQDLGANFMNMGILLRATNRPKEAETAYAESLAIYKQLVADYPALPELRNQLALSENNIARLYLNTARPQDAEAAYTAAIAIHRKLVADYPTRPDFRLQLARSLNNFGSMLKNREHAAEAEKLHLEAVTITKQLIAEYPTPPEFRQELANSHNNLGTVYRVVDRLPESEAAQLEALMIKRQLSAEFPTHPDFHQSLAGSYLNLANVCNQREDYAAAKNYLEQALPHHRAALKINPRHPDYRVNYRNSLRTLASTNAWLNDQAGALLVAQAIQSLGWEPGTDAYSAARSLSQCIPIAEKIKTLDTAQRQEAAKFYADQSMALLRDAVAKGWKNIAQTQKDPDLDGLRQRDDFQQLLKELKQE